MAELRVRLRPPRPRYDVQGSSFSLPRPRRLDLRKVPEKYAPPATAPWGRTPVIAVIDGRECRTSVWRDKKHGTLLPVAKAVRGGKGDGDTVTIELRVASG